MAALENSVGWVDPDERRLIAAAMLALNLSIPTEQSGRALLPLANRSETTGWRLYESAVAGFYAATLRHRGWSVRQAGPIHWPMSDPTPGLHDIMPRMVTDIVLERRGHDAGCRRPAHRNRHQVHVDHGARSIRQADAKERSHVPAVRLPSLPGAGR